MTIFKQSRLLFTACGGWIEPEEEPPKPQPREDKEGEPSQVLAN